MKNKSLLLITCLFIILIIAVITLWYNIIIIERPVNSESPELVITVGRSGADISGYTSESIQTALDMLKAQGGGTVKLTPGKFEIIGPVRLYSHTSLIGSGEETILQKCDKFSSKIIADVDSGTSKATVEDPSGFEVGMGIQIFDDEHHINWVVTTTKVTAIDGQTLYLDNKAVRSYSASRNGIVSNGCPIVEGAEVEDVKISDFVIEGNKDNSDYINGCRGGGIYLYKAKNCLVERVKVNDFNGDPFSWQSTENITVRNCEASNSNGRGFHPGTGSARTIIENCKSHHNTRDGIYLCWRVQNGIFRDNISYKNKMSGISIGYKDTDNIFINNHIYENAMHGVLFREQTEELSGHRNTFRNNIIENNGRSSFKAYGFYIGGYTHDIVIENNVIRSTGLGNQATAVCVGKNSSMPKMSGNDMSGCEKIIKEK